LLNTAAAGWGSGLLLFFLFPKNNILPYLG
jgi:hypothetical protein